MILSVSQLGDFKEGGPNYPYLAEQEHGCVPSVRRGKSAGSTAWTHSFVVRRHVHVRARAATVRQDAVRHALQVRLRRALRPRRRGGGAAGVVACWLVRSARAVLRSFETRAGLLGLLTARHSAVLRGQGVQFGGRSTASV